MFYIPSAVDILKVKLGKGDSMSHIRKEKHVQAHRPSVEHSRLSVPAALELRGNKKHYKTSLDQSNQKFEVVFFCSF